MKKKIIEFKCDHCDIVKQVEEDEGYPYGEGWCFIFKLNIQLPVDGSNNKHRRVEKEEKHLCSKKCLTEFISGVL